MHQETKEIWYGIRQMCQHVATAQRSLMEFFPSDLEILSQSSLYQNLVEVLFFYCVKHTLAGMVQVGNQTVDGVFTQVTG